MAYRLGIDLGGTKLAIGVVGEGGRVLGERVIRDHVGLAEEAVLDRIEEGVDLVLGDAGLARKDVAGAGVLFPGHIRWPEGRTLATSNLPGFRDFPLRARLEERLGLPVMADNDANGQTLGEYRYGAGIGCEHMAFMTVSTGVGGGIVIDGKLYRGATGTAGEFGHMIVDATGGQPCGCGNRGCLMGAASGLALPRLAREAAGAAGKAVLPASCPDFEDLTGETLATGFYEDNPLCRTVVEELARYIGIGLYNLFQILNPQVVVLGGGLLGLPGFFFETAMKTCYDLAGAMMYERMEIRKGLLGARAGMLGAAALIDP
jgi:glucokinase